MNNQIKDTMYRGNSATNSKKNYSSPTLQKYGEVKHLTTGGSGNASENSNGLSKRT